MTASLIQNQMSSQVSGFWGILFGSTYNRDDERIVIPCNREESNNGCSLMDVSEPSDWDRSSDDDTLGIVNL